MDKRKKDLDDIEELEDEELEDNEEIEENEELESEEAEELEDEEKEDAKEEKKSSKKKEKSSKPVPVEEPKQALEPITPAGIMAILRSPMGASVLICSLVAIVALLVIIFSGGSSSEPAHTHTFGEWEIVKAATCLEAGEEKGTCSCGEVETRTVEAKGHNEEILPAVPATCTNTGLTEGKKCSECNTITVPQNEIEKTAHEFGDDNICDNCEYERCDHLELESIPGKEATCKESGLSVGKRCASCQAVVVEQTVIPALAHTYGRDDICDLCGYERNADCQHTNTEVIKGKDATCTEAGLTDGLKCKDCGEVIEQCENIAIKPHTEVIDPAKEATCKEAGLSEGKHCSVCEQVLVKQVEVSKLAHTYTTDYKTCDVCGEKREKVCYHLSTTTIEGKDATCTEYGLTDGEVCVECGEVLISQKTILLKEHTPVVDYAREATCTSSGLTEGAHCSVCNTVLVAQQIIEKKPHTKVTIEAIKSSCTSSGLTEGKYCSECENILVEQKFTEALGHHYMQTVVAPTCTERGYTVYACTRCYDTYRDDYVDMLEHSASEWIIDVEPTYVSTGKKHKECTECGMVFEAAVMPMLAHTYVSSVTTPTCTQIGYTTHTCTDCGHSYTDNYTRALGHSFTGWTERTPATCETDGVSYRTCTRCSTEEKKIVPATGHELYTSAAKAPTCDESGFEAFEICANCSYNTKVIIPATGHKAGDWIIDSEATFESDGSKHRKCTECDKTVEESVIPALNHVLSSVVTPPTCTERGYTTHTCTDCGKIYVDSYVDALGHDFGEWKETKAPTCDENGEKRRDCNSCEHFETLVVTKLSHVLGDWEEHSAPTCEENGENRRNCANCDFYISETVSALGHSYSQKIVEPTCTTQGYTEYTCATCQHTYKDLYTTLKGHSFNTWNEVPSTCTTNGSFSRECTECGALEERIVVATGHSYTKEIIAPTCTERGYTKYTCHCGDTYNNDFEDALAHDFGDWYVSKASTCTEIGENRRDCSRCNGYETYALSKLTHDYNVVVIAPTCTFSGYTTYTCKDCGHKYSTDETEALGHSIVEYVFQEPSCTNSGLVDRKCERCGEFVERVNADKLGHRLITHPALAPTCTEDGWKEYQTCTRCDYTTYRVDSATGHTLKNHTAQAPTCTESGWGAYELCSVCDYSTYEEIPALGHEIRSFEGKEPTCTEDGWKAYEECSRCTYSTYEVLEAFEHDYVEYDAKEPTCTEIGWYAYKKCTRCGTSTYKERAPLGHNYTKTETVEPTCTEKGYTAKICLCGYSLVESYVDPTGHSFGDWVTVREPSCNEIGEKHKKCSNCDYFEAEIIDKLDHIFENGVCNMCGVQAPTVEDEEKEDTSESDSEAKTE